MATEVELNGMTINLVPDKAAYDGMDKEPNEMYLVQDDYDMVVEIHNQPDTDMSDPDFYTGAVVTGSAAAIAAKLDADPGYVPRILAKLRVYYGTTLSVRNEIVSPWLEYYTNGTGLGFVTHWTWNNTPMVVSINGAGQVSAYVAFLRN